MPIFTEKHARAIDLIELYAPNNKDSYRDLVLCRKALQSGDKSARMYARKAYRKAKAYMLEHHPFEGLAIPATQVRGQIVDNLVAFEQAEIDCGNTYD